MSKIAQHLGRISGLRSGVIRTMLLSAVLLVPAVVVAQAPAIHFKVLHTFHGANGATPAGALIWDNAGNAYGSTATGGDLDCSLNPGGGCGTVFQFSTAAHETLLHRFKGPDGFAPFFERLHRDSQGNLYGTAVAGGNTGNGCGSVGCGTVFKLDTTGKETVLHKFLGGIDSGSPVGDLLLDGEENIYGTASGAFTGDCGAVFKIDTTGRETVLHTFGCAINGDAAGPTGLVEDTAGKLYGVTFGGGYYKQYQCGLAGCGTIYKLDKSGTETILYKFTGGTDGGAPNCLLTLDAHGNLYGTTGTGGTFGLGTVFKWSKTAGLTVLYSFSGPDGSFPEGLLLDADGTLYGTTVYGGNGGCGAFGCGTVFKLTLKTRHLTVLHKFSGGKDGANPAYGLAINSTGTLYGTTTGGGDLKCANPFYGGSGCGVMFTITP